MICRASSLLAYGLALAVAPSGCGGTKKGAHNVFELENKITPGMTPEQVSTVAGDPDETFPTTVRSTDTVFGWSTTTSRGTAVF